MDIIKVDFKTGKRIKDDPIENSPVSNGLPLFHRSDYKPSHNCRNNDTYGIICVKCGECGRIFSSKKSILNRFWDKIKGR